MVHLTGALLAGRSAGTFALSAGLAASAALSHSWDRSPWRARPSMGGGHASRPPLERSVSYLR